MPFLSQESLQPFIDKLVADGPKQNPTSELVYLFSTARVLHQNSTSLADIKKEGIHYAEFIRFAADIFGIDDEQQLVWHGIQFPNKGANAGWRKSKDLASMIYSNLLSTPMRRKEEDYSKKFPVLNLDTGEAKIHSKYVESLKDIFSDANIALCFVFALVRSYEFEEEFLNIDSIFDAVSQRYGEVGATIIGLIKDSAIDVPQEAYSTSNEVVTLLDLLNKYFTASDKIPPEEYAIKSNLKNTTNLEGSLINENFLEDDFRFPEQDHLPLNLLFKGVPGTGKSYLIDKIITDCLKLGRNAKNVKRLNVHSASDNTTFMQGVGVALTGSSNDSSIIYTEKRGEVLKHLVEAIKHPNQPFVLVLEEIQENSLNELIGDLIYLIEPAKRVDISAHTELLDGLNKGDEHEMLNILAEQSDIYSVQMPALIEDTNGLSLVFPQNLYVFCTTNYRDDKKIVEDNLMRRFDVIDLFPNTHNSALYEAEYIRAYLERLNNSIIDKLKDIETHPDRFLVGHSRFMKDVVYNKTSFCKALKKVLDEFKEIRDIEFHSFKEILVDSELELLEGTGLLDSTMIEAIKGCEDYRSLAETLQNHSGYVFLQ